VVAPLLMMGPVIKKLWWECYQTWKIVAAGEPHPQPQYQTATEYESGVDTWALGCALVEMVTGKPAWNSKPGTNMFVLLIRIGEVDEMPIRPEKLSQEGKDFLLKILHKDGLLRCFWNILLLLINGKTLFHWEKKKVKNYHHHHAILIFQIGFQFNHHHQDQSFNMFAVQFIYFYHGFSG